MVVGRSQAILEHETRHAERVEPLGHIVPLIAHRQVLVTAPRANHHRASVGNGGTRKMDCQRGLIFVGGPMRARSPLGPKDQHRFAGRRVVRCQGAMCDSKDREQARHKRRKKSPMMLSHEKFPKFNRRFRGGGSADRRYRASGRPVATASHKPTATSYKATRRSRQAARAKRRTTTPEVWRSTPWRGAETAGSPAIRCPGDR